MSAKRKKKNINKSVIIIIVLSVLIVVGFFLCTSNPKFWFKKSIHADAKRYSTRHCLVYYPKGAEGKRIAKQICKDEKEDKIYDYSLIPYGDYFLVSYGNGVEYFIDKDNKPLNITDISDDGKRIVADYLRYTIKKDQPDKYYNSEFIANTVYDNLNFGEVTYDIYEEYLRCNFPSYDIDVLVPLKYVQNELGMNFGYENELYRKPVYIDSNHPVICLTFDDGPTLWCDYDESSSVSIVDTLYKYDANATFYVVGYALDERDYWSDYELYSFLEKSINNGNEYGSHTAGHENLVDLTAEQIDRVIKEPADFIKDVTNYDVVTYRPPGGVFDESVLAVQPYAAILWDADSGDWNSRDAEAIYNKVMSYDYDDGDVILFHDIYDTTADAIKKIVPTLIDKGYQLVTVKDMLQYSGIDVYSLKYYYNLNPSPYYE